MAESAVVAVNVKQEPSLLSRMASRFGVEPTKMLTTLKATAFRGEVSNEQMMALLIVAEQYRLNPWVREIYAFPDKNNGIVPVVGVDGWLRIINEHPQYDGCEFADGPIGEGGTPEWIECKIFRKDRSHATVAREYMSECKRETGPWKSHPRRLLRHKALIQAGRIAMAFVGIYDPDEAERIVQGETLSIGAADPLPIAELNAKISGSRKREKIAPVDPPPPEDERPPLELDGVAMPAPQYGEVRSMLDDARKAKDVDALDLATSLIGSLPVQFQAELRDLAAATKRELDGK